MNATPVHDAPATSLADSRAHCEQVTREAAANFYWGIRLLSEDKRSAMCAVYAYARRIDDIGDGPLPSAEKLRRLADARAAVTALSAGSGDPVMAALADAAQRFPLPRQSMLDLIDGVEMDLAGTRYDTIDELVVYCRRVAGSIGRLCLAIFGAEAATATVAGVNGGDLADDLGVAMQLTNILRDVREDALNGRVYLPVDDLARFGWMRDGESPLDGVGRMLAAAAQPAASPVALVRFEAARARDWFDRGLRLVDLLDRRSSACVLAMTGIYRKLLEQLDAQPAQVTQRRVSLSKPHKLVIAGTSLARGLL